MMKLSLAVHAASIWFLDGTAPDSNASTEVQVDAKTSDVITGELVAAKGVKHGKLTLTTGKDLLA